MVSSRPASPPRIPPSVPARARPIVDRLYTPTPAAQGHAVRPGLLAAWRDLLGGDDAALDKRLAWDGLDRATATHRLGTAAAPAANQAGAAPAPSWCGLLEEAFGGGAAGPAPADAPAELPGDGAGTGRAPLPFEALYVPLLRVARARLAREAGAELALLADEAREALERGLLVRLAQLWARTMYVEFDVFRMVGGGGAARPDGAPGAARYAQFLGHMAAGGWWRALGDYPVAARLSGVITEQWVASSAEFLRRLAADRADLGAELFGGAPVGRVVALRPDLGDAHGGGRSVAVVTFEGGRRAVYKPRPVDLDVVFGRLTRWLTDAGLRPALAAPPTVARDGYGWSAFVDAAPCRDAQEVERFYTRCGALLAVAHALNGTDFHLENLIAAGEHPMLIDCEALVAHRFALDGAADRRDAAGTGHTDAAGGVRSVLRIGLLPHLRLDASGALTDLGGIGGGLAEDGRVVHAPRFVDINTDRMRVVRAPSTAAPAAANRARLGGADTDPAAYVEHMAAGFAAAYRLLLAARPALLAPGGPLAGLDGVPVRFIFRNTSVYAGLLGRLSHPTFLRDSAERAVQLDVLARPLLAGATRPTVWPLLRAEQAALERMDVPFFAAPAGATGLPLEDGRVIPDCFARSAVAELEAALHALSEADLACQLAVLRGAFAARARGAGPSTHVTNHLPAPATSGGDRPGASTAAAATCLAAAVALGERICAAAVPLGSGEVTWFAARYLGAERRFQMDVADHSLHHGAPGIALFLAALEGAAPARGFGAMARRALGSPLLDDAVGRLQRRRGAVDLGAGTGVCSTIYALAHAARLLDEPALLARARAWAEWVTPDLVQRARGSDVMSGAAGAVVALLTLYDASVAAGGEAADGAAAVLARARELGAVLLAAGPCADGGAPAWPSPGRPPAADVGMAHGQAGIACALARLDRTVGGDAALRVAAARALDDEFARAARAAELPPGWCQGEAGLALARVRVHGTPDPALDRALAAACAGGRAGPDALAGPTLTDVELLLCAGQRLGRPALVDAARRRAADVAAAVLGAGPPLDTGWGCGYQDLGLLHGLAGVGWQLLRAGAPGRLPALLAWD
jgi:type 2 lantibiotic biosynthesis protein LanM